MYRVLLISANNWDSLKEVPVILKNAGCEVEIYAAEGSWVLANNFFDKWIDAGNYDEEFAARLIAYLELYADNYDWIIPGDDIIIRQLNNKITSPDLFRKVMPVTKIENRALLGSKAGLSDLCKQYNIQTPKYLVHDDTQTAESIAQYMGFPMMIKEDESEGGFGVYRCDSTQELTEMLSKIANKKNLVFQQLIDGEDVNTDALFKDGHLIVYSHSLRMKTIGAYGISTQRVFLQNSDTDKILSRLGSILGLNGFSNIVFIKDNVTQEYYLIEIDMRPNSWMYYGRFAGNDFSEAIRKIIAGDRTHLQPHKKDANRKIIITLYKKDIYRCITHKDVKGIMNWVVNRNQRWKYIPTYDKKLFRTVNKYLFDTFKGYLVAKRKKMFR